MLTADLAVNARPAYAWAGYNLATRMTDFLRMAARPLTNFINLSILTTMSETHAGTISTADPTTGV
jgi:hypothetical protein